MSEHTLDQPLVLELQKQIAHLASLLEDQPQPYLRSQDFPSDRNRLTAIGTIRKRSLKPGLPDPRLVRRIIRHRQLRSRYLGDNLFADPAFDMLLDLTAAHTEHKRVSVTSLCIASGVPPTTALRWVTLMVERGILTRTEDEIDQRRAFISLSEQTALAIARYFEAIEKEDVYQQSFVL